jgi:predicted dehydrogenase
MSEGTVLIVGVGSIGERHLRSFAATGRVRVSICELNPALRQTVAERHGVAGVFDSLDSALSTKPTATVICTPAHLHVPMALTAAKAGSHLLIEKPLSTSLQNIDALQKIVDENGRKVSVAYVYRAHPVLQAMREAIIDKRFGSPVQIVAICGQNFPHYRPAYRETYYRDRATGGGAVQDALTHIINAAEWLIGPTDNLVADIDHKILQAVSVEDTAHVLTRHGKVMGSFSLNQHQAPNETTITVVCERGTVRFEGHRNRWRWQTDPAGQWHDETGGPLERDALFTRQANAFLDTLGRGQTPLCSLAEGLQTLRVNLAILKSSENRCWEKLN